LRNKWVNPPPREKPTNDVSDQESTSIGKRISFTTIKDQIGKKSVSKKSKSERVLSKFSDGND
jgi:hypothetical protein